MASKNTRSRSESGAPKTGLIDQADILEAMSRLQIPLGDARNFAPQVLSFLEECYASHTHDWGAAGSECDYLFDRQRDMARHALGVITRADPYVRPVGAGAAARLRLQIPGDGVALDISPTEMIALRFAVARSNAMLADGTMKLDGFGNLEVRAESRREVLGRLGAFQFSAVQNASAANILPIVVTVHWWGSCTCYTLIELYLVVVLLALITLGLLAFPATQWFGLAMTPAVVLLTAYATLSGVSGLNKGLCVYSTPFGSFSLPW